jgi:16S rRNA (cytosine967-C5)-methyltransferase
LAAELRRVAADETEAAALALALDVPGPVCLRANTLRVTRPQLAERLAAEGIPTHPCTASPVGLIAEHRFNVLGSPSHRAGLFEVQDEGSQLIGLLLEAAPGESVLDLCAGAGGKTLLLAAAMENRGSLHAFDTDFSRLDRLAIRAEAAGAQVVTHHALAPSLRVDRVLVDAPCSELGALRRGPDLRWRIDPSTFAPLPQTQLALCETALTHLRPGGRLVYATCTFRPDENAGVAHDLERRHPALRRLDGFFQCWPHRDGTDGFFAAVYQWGG